MRVELGLTDTELDELVKETLPHLSSENVTNLLAPGAAEDTGVQAWAQSIVEEAAAVKVMQTGQSTTLRPKELALAFLNKLIAELKVPV